MLPIELKGKDLQDYLFQLTRDKSQIRHVNYDATVKHAEEMAVHAWGEKPKEILEKARPREEESVKQYRLDSWEPITLSKFDKAIYILQKIFNPKLFSIVFPPQPGGIKLSEDESLEYYTRKFYPNFDDIFSFCSEVVLKQMIADPNGVLAVVPTRYDLPQNELQSPVAVLFNSKQVLDKKEGIYFVLKDQTTVKRDNVEGSIIHLFTVNEIVTYEEVISSGEYHFRETARYVHNFGIIPVWHLGGITDSRTFPFAFKSFFNAALPHWNKAIRLDSDLDGAYINHLHPQKWEMALDCDYSDENHNMCRDGIILDIETNKSKTCRKCQGTGKMSITGPYDIYKISTDKIKGLEGSTSPIPPAGYITVPTDIINVLKQTVEENINNGLSAINMDIVNKIGENQSGVAKELDRSELDSFMAKVSDYMFDNHLPNLFYFINRFRYSTVIGTRVDEYLPILSKPSNFDILSISEITNEISVARQNNSNSVYLTSLELDLIEKRFSTQERIKETARLSIYLNPFPNVSSEDKTNMELRGTATKLDLIVSDNIVQFVRRAMEEENNFVELERAKQMEILKDYARELITEVQAVTNNLIQ